MVCRGLFMLFALGVPNLAHALPQITHEGNSDVGRPDERHSDLYRGIQIIGNTCTRSEVEVVENAILDASYLAGAGLAAAKNYSSLPFKFFFPNDIDAAGTVAGVYRRVQGAQRGNGPLIFVGCQDDYHRCNVSTNPGYTVQFRSQHRSPHIIICPLGLALERSPTPCTRNPGGIFLGWLMLRLIVSLRSISGFGITNGDGRTETAAQIGAMVAKGSRTTHDPNAIAFLGSWSWDMGLGGPPWNEQETCLDKFSDGTFDASLGPFENFFG